VPADRRKRREVHPRGFGVLTHCNAGALATAGRERPIGHVRAQKKAAIRVYADGDPSLLQGSRLTAWNSQAAST